MKWDFNEFDDILLLYLYKYDYVVIDLFYVFKDIWEKYGEVVLLLF